MRAVRLPRLRVNISRSVCTGGETGEGGAGWPMLPDFLAIHYRFPSGGITDPADHPGAADSRAQTR